MLLSYRRSLGPRAHGALALVLSTFFCVFMYRSWTVIYQWQAPLAHSRTAIPNKIWYKLGPKGLSEDMQKWTSSCVSQNPHHQVQFMTDEQASDYVQRTFAGFPSIVDSYLNVTIPILKADLFRYLVLYAEGGVWFDLDVSCEGVPISEWVPQERRNSVNMVVGWEFDAGYEDFVTRQFNSWTIMSKPRLPHMATVIGDIMNALSETAATHGVQLADVKMDMISDVVDFTGPRRLTNSVFKSLGMMLNSTIDMHSIINIREPKLIGDVLILPGYSFAASMNHYGEDEVLGPQLVTHHYAGSWKNENGGELLR
ncbi:hypothetical protein BX600DRAFT_233009 [Xylariales sp. PMI_506]|nr:hypothetical protein BX600DRAFT_233009 [Xylariales sp. PMI_506]